MQKFVIEVRESMAMDASSADELGREKEETQPGLTRRRFTQGAIGAAALFAVGGAGRAFAGEVSLLRPPGGQDEDLLMGACIRCDRCRSACPTEVIDVATVSDGLLNARTPKMNFHLGACDTCDGEYKCIRACTTGALTLFDPEVNKIGMAVIDFDKCEAYGISAQCKYECVEVCPNEALEKLEDGRLSLDEDLCWGCGMCENVCPTNSYRAYSGSTARGVNIAHWEVESRG